MATDNTREPSDTALYFRSPSAPGIFYRSGLTVYDEALDGGRLVGRYWSTVGAIKPEAHLAQQKAAFDLLPVESFHLRIDDRVLDRGWQLVAGREEQDARPGERHAVVDLEQASLPIFVRVHTRFDGSPFLVRWLEITNNGDRPVSLSAVSPFAGLLWVVRGYPEFVGTGPTFSLGYYRNTQPLEEGGFVWEALATGRRTVEGRLGRSGHRRPSFMLRNEASGETFVGELAWSSNWTLSATVGADETKRETWLAFEMGPVAADPTLRVIAPGETVATPAVHLGHLHADLDGCTQALHAHFRKTVLPANAAGRVPLIEANHRGYIPDHESEPGLIREIDSAADLGAEIFVVDAGWFGPDPNRWWQNVGDWHAGSWLPNDLFPAIDHAHKKGMLFGLWVELESVGSASRLRREHPDWVLIRDGMPVADGRHLDVANPAVAEWMEAEVARIISRYNLDLFRLDYNTHIYEGGNRLKDGFVESTLWRQVEPIWGIFERARRRFPNVVFENCAAGGGRLDLGILRYFDLTEISDWMVAPRSLKILNGLTLTLPPEICLRTFGTEVTDHYLYGDLEFQIRSCLFGRPILRGIAPSLDEIGEPKRSRVRHALDVYKRFVRPLLPECRVYHHTPVLSLTEPEPWCVLEYAAADGAREVAGIFRTSAQGDGMYRYRPRGLTPGRRYRVTLDNTGETAELSGLELQRDGLGIRIDIPLSSELLLVEEVAD